ncbi:MAG: peptidylprolyl isomerase [Planctomycetes bacterium]|nr:peptidylprolyl isomerase [Planctomycetota bacterium]
MLRFLASLVVVAASVGCSKPSHPAQGSSKAPPDPVGECDAFITKSAIDTAKDGWRLRLPEPPEFLFDPARTYFWVIETNVGTARIRLMPDVAPMHVSSTIYLARLGFYDGLTFHRVIPGFMAQGGDPAGDGSGGPGYQYASEIDTRVRHDRRGLLSMANKPRPRTDGSQFFLTFAAIPHLDGKHTIFGEVVEGMETLRELERRGTKEGPPTERLVMVRTQIEVR